jgi:hypothetical protein
VAALANLSKDAIKDGYIALKDALKKKFGETSDVVEAIDKLEKSPDRDDRKATVKTEVEIAKLNDDPEILKLVQDLSQQLEVTEPSGGGISISGGVKGVVATNISGATITQGNIS